MSDLNALLQEAQSESTAPERLQELAAEENPAEVRQACAANPMTPLETLNVLAEEFPSEFLANPTTQLQLQQRSLNVKLLPQKSRKALASYLNSPPDLLQALAEDAAWEVRKETASNLNCPEEVLVKLAVTDDSEDVLIAVARNPNCHPCVLEGLVQECEDLWDYVEYHKELIEAIADNPNTPQEVFIEFTCMGFASSLFCESEYAWTKKIIDKSGLPLQREWISFNECRELWDISNEAPSSAIQELWEKVQDYELAYEYRGLISAIASAKNCPLPILQELTSHSSDDIRTAVADNPSAPLASLKILADDDSWLVRSAVADNPACTPEILSQLAEDKDKDIRESVTANPLTPLDLLDHLVIENPSAFLDNPSTQLRLLDVKSLLDELPNKSREALASCPDSPIFLLQKLAEDEDVDVRGSIAENPKCPPEILDRLAWDERWEVRLTVIKNLQCPPEVLAIIYDDLRGEDQHEEYEYADYNDFLKVIATHPRCPLSILESLAEDEETDVVLAVTRNPNCPPEILEKLADDAEKNVVLAVSKHPACPTKIIEAIDLLAKLPYFSKDELIELFKDESPKIFLINHAVASHPNCPPEILAKLTEDKHWLIRRAVVAHQNCSSEILMALAEDDHDDVRKDVAKHPQYLQVSSDVLAALSESQDKRVRKGVAAHPNCSLEILEKLSEDEEIDVLCAIFKHSSYPPKALEKLAKRKNCRSLSALESTTRKLLAQHHNASTEVLMSLADDENSVIRAAVAENPNSSSEVLIRLAADKSFQSSNVRATVARRSDCPVDLIQQLATDDSWVVRAAVASSDHCPSEILDRLAEDDNAKVQKAALEQQQRRQELQEDASV